MMPPESLKPEAPQTAARGTGRGQTKKPHHAAATSPLESAPGRTLGRPPKFASPSRPITVTLPESTLQGLKCIHPDCGQAIVKLTEAAVRRSRVGHPAVEIVEMAANIGIILVGPSKALRRIPFLHLVEVADSRFLLALDPGHDLSGLEIAIRDMIDDISGEENGERELLRDLLEAIKQVRKAERVSIAEILFVKPGENE